jgi:hypothetical protein
VPASPRDDSIARVLREHFDTEAVDAGLRSPDWQSGGIRSASSPDAGMFARAIRFRQDEHRRVREALARVSPEHREALELAYGVAFRERDVDDGSRRRAPRTSERNWRVRLREIYDFPECAVVLAASIVGRSIGVTDAGGFVDRVRLMDARGRDGVKAAALELLEQARREFAAVYEPPRGFPRLDAAPPRRTRRFDRERLRREAEEDDGGGFSI